MDIYPAREVPMKGVTSKLIFELINKEKKYMISDQKLLQRIEKENIQILATIGAGGIDRHVPNIKKLLLEKDTKKKS